MSSIPSVAADVLPQNIANVMQHRNLPAETLSIYVESLDTGEPVLAWNEAEPRNPASVMKILTTLVALDILGPTYRWETNLYVLGDVDQGELKGDLLMQGSGDPFLVTDRFWQMLRLLRQAGIQKIDGELLLDDSYFSIPFHDAAAFDREPLRAYNLGPNALLSNLKVVRYVFEPVVSKVGSKAHFFDRVMHLVKFPKKWNAMQQAMNIPLFELPPPEVVDSPFIDSQYGKIQRSC